MNVIRTFFDLNPFYKKDDLIEFHQIFGQILALLTS